MSERPDWFTRALAEPVEVDEITVDGCPIAIRRWGDPSLPGLVFVHGGGAHSRWWDHVAPFFSRECCITALDLSGHGDSGRRPEYTFDHCAAEIAAVATSGPSAQPPVIVAHSLGGLSTFCAAARYGETFEGVIIVDSAIRPESREQQARRSRDAFGPLKVYPTREAILARFRTVPDQPNLLPYVIDHIKEHSVRPVDGGWTWKFDPTFFDHLKPIGGDTLGAISCRVAVLGAQHGLVTREVAQHMYNLLGRTSPVVEIPLAYHHIMLDQPVALVTAIRSLLADWRHSYSIRDFQVSFAPEQ